MDRPALVARLSSATRARSLPVQIASMPDSTLSSPRPAPRWFIWFGCLALAGYGVFLQFNSTVAAGGADSSGYLNSAQLLAAGRRETHVRLPAGFDRAAETFRPHFQPLGFTAFAENDRLVPTYPTGLPLHLALAQKVLGESLGVRCVEFAAAVAAVWLCYALGFQLGLGRPLAAAGAIVLAACPVMIFTSIQPLSDTLATAWCIGAMWAAARATRGLGWAAATGLAFGVAVLVRPTNLVLLPALLVLLGINWRKLAAMALGGVAPAAWLASYNHALYGGAFRSGYAGLSANFDTEWIAPTAQHFVHWLAITLPAVCLVLPFVAVLRPGGRGRALIALALWFGAITGVYLCYNISHEAWTCLRFILPALPALILASLFGLKALAARAPQRGTTITAVILASWALIASWYWSRHLAVYYIKSYEDPYMKICAIARAQLPANALVVTSHASGALFHYTSFPILRWDFVTPEKFKAYVELARQQGLPIGAVVFNVEVADGLREHCPGNWTRVATADALELWRLDAPAELITPSPAR
jgi:hypothetical protein